MIHPLAVSLALAAAPAAPADAQPSAAQQGHAAQAEAINVAEELSDPRFAARLTEMMKALSKTVMTIKVGEIRAAAEGREATEAENELTIADLGRIDDPDFERNLERQLADAKPAIEAGMKALATALPAMMKGMSEAAESLERATANLPSPTYPER